MWKLEDFKVRKMGQNLHANMEGFRRASHKWVQLKQFLADRDDGFDDKIITFVNNAVLCLITTRYHQHVYLMVYVLKNFQKSYHS